MSYLNSCKSTVVSYTQGLPHTTPRATGKWSGLTAHSSPLLRTLPKDHKHDWKNHVNKVVHAYNCTRHESTGYSPFFLLFGRSPRLPIDLVFGNADVADSGSQRAYVQKWTECMREAYSIANKNAKTAALKGKRHHDRGLSSVVLNPGDRVLVRNLSERGGPGKLRSYWESDVHVVVKRMSEDSPVYQVKSERGDQRCRILHRNLLLPCVSLPLETVEASKGTKVRRSKASSRYVPVPPPSSSSSGADEWVPVVPPNEGEKPLSTSELYDTAASSQGSSLNPEAEEFVPQEAGVPADVESELSQSESEERRISGGSPVEENSSDSETGSGQVRKSRRVRNAPRMLTYNSMGNPSYQPKVQWLGFQPSPWVLVK